MNIIVTGATGYLGSRLVFTFLKQGHHVLCIKLPSDEATALDRVKDQLSFLNTDDILYADKISKFQPDTVVHTACAYERDGTNLLTLAETNLWFPLQLLNICAASGMCRWINTSTALKSEVNIYALSKAQFAQWGERYARKYGISFINLQPEHFYGEDGPAHHFISWVIRSLQNNETIRLTEGTQQRDFMCVDDLVNVYLQMLTAPINGYLDIPVGTGISPTIREVVEYLAIITQSTSDIQFGAVSMRSDEPSSNCDTNVLKHFGVNCTTFWKDGMKKVVEKTI